MYNDKGININKIKNCKQLKDHKGGQESNLQGTNT